MAKKKKSTKKRKHFKAPWWKLFFVIAAATFIAIPVSNALNTNSSSPIEVLGTKTTTTPTPPQKVKKTRVVVDIQFFVFYDTNGDGVSDKDELSVPQQRINVTYFYSGQQWKLTTIANGYANLHFEKDYTTPIEDWVFTQFTARLLLNPNYRSTNANPVQVDTKNSAKYNASTQTKTLKRTGYYTFGIKAK